MNASTFEKADEIDYLIANVTGSVVTPDWLINTYSQRNWVEVFYLGTGQKARKWLQRLQEKGLIGSYQTSNKTLRYNEPT